MEIVRNQEFNSSGLWALISGCFLPWTSGASVHNPLVFWSGFRLLPYHSQKSCWAFLNHLFNQFQIVCTWFQGQSAHCLTCPCHAIPPLPALICWSHFFAYLYSLLCLCTITPPLATLLLGHVLCSHLRAPFPFLSKPQCLVLNQLRKATFEEFIVCKWQTAIY